jgi:hypothetical protein
MKYMGIWSKGATPESIKQILQKHNKQKPKQPTNLGQALAKTRPRPTQQPTREGRWPDAPARVRSHPRNRLLGPLSSGGAINAPGVSFGWFPKLSPQTDHRVVYKKRWSSFSTHLIWSQTPHPLLYSFYILVVFCEQGKSYQGELGSLEERIFGMNNMKNSSKVLLLFYPYSSAYELEYSFHVIWTSI